MTFFYDFWYQYLKKEFSEKIQLVYTDTDAFLFKTGVPDFKVHIEKDLEKYFDTSDYSDETISKYNYRVVNKKVLGKFKDECNGYPITHFVGTRAKCYAINVEKPEKIEVKARMKGVNKCVVKNLDLKTYLHTLHTGIPFEAEMYRFNFKKHEISTVKVRKAGLTTNDDKRFEIPKDKHCRTLAWGNKRIPEIEFLNKMEHGEPEIVSVEPQVPVSQKRKNSDDLDQEELIFKKARHI